MCTCFRYSLFQYFIAPKKTIWNLIVFKKGERKTYTLRNEVDFFEPDGGDEPDEPDDNVVNAS